MGRKTGMNKDFYDSATLNNYTWMQYYNRLVELSCVMFDWVGMPETVDIRTLERTLFENGCAMFFRDDTLGYLALPTAVGGALNVYGIPMQRNAVAPNKFTARRDEKDSVLIWNNYLRTGSKLDAIMFARRLYNMDRTIDVNINAQKTPILVRCSEQQRLTLQNVYKQYDGNTPVIFADKDLDMRALTVLTTQAPFIADKVREEKTSTWNEALTYLGISNVNVVKKERLVSDEVSRNMGGTIASRYSRLEMRRTACNQINAMFPELHVECHYREDYREMEGGNVYPDETTEEGADNPNE